MRDALHKNELAVLQLTDIDPSGAPVLITRVIHTSGEHVEGRYPLVCKDMTDAQKLGSSMSYARRYALSAMLGVIQSDDDGNAASAPKATPAPAPAAKQGPASIFAAHKLEYPQSLEQLIGKPMKEWTDGDKVTARQAVQALTDGKPWSEIIRNNVFK